MIVLQHFNFETSQRHHSNDGTLFSLVLPLYIEQVSGHPLLNIVVWNYPKSVFFFRFFSVSLDLDARLTAKDNEGKHFVYI